MKIFFVLDTNTRTRGHNFKLIAPRFQVACRRNFFSVRIVPVWNSLPVNIVNSVTLDDFKRDVKKHNLSKFLTRDYDNFNPS